jgi:PEP-CTERM motif
MTYRNALAAIACLWLVAHAAPAAAQTVVYDSSNGGGTSGFEPTRFTGSAAGVPLGGQDPLTADPAHSGPWQRSGGAGGSTAVVQTTVVDTVNGGTQAVKLTRAPGDVAFWGVQRSLTNPSVVTVTWRMRVDGPSGNPSTQFGPFMGIQANGVGGQIADFGVDATTGDLLYQDPVNGLQTPNTPVIVPFGTWHSYQLELDYNGTGGGTYKILYDGVQQAIANSNFFTNTGNNSFTDAPIAGASAGSDPLTGVAYFDNYVITAVPEPTSLGLAGVGLAGLAYRRRRRTRV